MAAADGFEALQAAQVKKFDVILLDVRAALPDRPRPAARLCATGPPRKDAVVSCSESRRRRPRGPSHARRRRRARQQDPRVAARSDLEIRNSSKSATRGRRGCDGLGRATAAETPKRFRCATARRGTVVGRGTSDRDDRRPPDDARAAARVGACGNRFASRPPSRSRGRRIRAGRALSALRACCGSRDRFRAANAGLVDEPVGAFAHGSVHEVGVAGIREQEHDRVLRAVRSRRARSRPRSVR